MLADTDCEARDAVGDGESEGDGRCEADDEGDGGREADTGNPGRETDTVRDAVTNGDRDAERLEEGVRDAVALGLPHA